MPPKRPPPLPRSLFTGEGPLSPGMAPQPPSPSTVHPDRLVDAHNSGSFLRLEKGDAKVVPPLTASVAVAVDGRPIAPVGLAAPDGSTKMGKQVTSPALLFSETAAEAPTPQSSLPAIDVVIPQTKPLTDALWDRLDDVVNRIDGGWGKVEKEAAEGHDGRKILVAGLLPPPLTLNSSKLQNDAAYVTHMTRLTQLSLHSDVVLKALPPVIDTTVASEPWWEDERELARVVKMYVAPAIETFGTHRIVFGSIPAAASAGTVNKEDGVIVPLSGEKWYALFRQCVAELGEDKGAMTDIMAANAERLYALGE